jgi:hypothetical protein
MQQQMAAYAGNSITTELIQKYLDENKQLILAILDNQNLGKLNECATYQAKLQQNLMYLAAIADAQPQVSQNSAQVPAAQSMQPLQQQYLQTHQQQQQQMMMNQRNSVPQYMQQSQQGSQNASPQSQQSYHNQQGVVPQGNPGMQMMNNAMGGNGNQASGNMSEYGKPEGSRDGTPTNLNTRNDGPQVGTSTLGHSREGNGVAGEDSEASYLKSSE